MRDAFDGLKSATCGARCERAGGAAPAARSWPRFAAVLALAGVAASQITQAPDVEHEVGVKPTPAGRSKECCSRR